MDWGDEAAGMLAEDDCSFSLGGGKIDKGKLNMKCKFLPLVRAFKEWDSWLRKQHLFDFHNCRFS